MMEHGNVILLLVAFSSGCALTALISCCFCSKQDKKRPPTYIYQQVAPPDISNTRQGAFHRAPIQAPVSIPAARQRKQYTCHLLLFPDGKIPCWNYNEHLLNPSKSCRCDRSHARWPDFLHSHEPRTSFVKILSLLTMASSSIDLCLFLFTIEQTAQLLVRLSGRGIRVRVVTDAGRKREEHNKGDKIPWLQEAGIEVRERPLVRGDYRPLMHHKFVIIDQNAGLLGSFNWTVQAVRHNDESVVATNDPAVMGPLNDEFRRLWDESPRATC